MKSIKLTLNLLEIFIFNKDFVNKHILRRRKLKFSPKFSTVVLRPTFGSETYTLRCPITCNTELHNSPIIPAPIISIFEPMSMLDNLSKACTTHDKGSHSTAAR